MDDSRFVVLNARDAADRGAQIHVRTKVVSARRAEGGWLNEWGMVHTREREERVWTLPTGLLALAAFQHGRQPPGDDHRVAVDRADALDHHAAQLGVDAAAGFDLQLAVGGERHEHPRHRLLVPEALLQALSGLEAGQRHGA